MEAVAASLPPLIERCPRGEASKLLEKALAAAQRDLTLPTAPRTVAGSKLVSKEDFLQALDELLPEEIGTSATGVAAAALVDRSTQAKVSQRIEELGRRKHPPSESKSPSFIVKAAGFLLMLAGFALVASGVLVAAHILADDQRNESAYVFDNSASCSGSFLENQPTFWSPLWDALEPVERYLGLADGTLSDKRKKRRNGKGRSAARRELNAEIAATTREL